MYQEVWLSHSLFGSIFFPTPNLYTKGRSTTTSCLPWTFKSKPLFVEVRGDKPLQTNASRQEWKSESCFQNTITHLWFLEEKTFESL